MSASIRTRRVCDGVWQLTDILDNRAYLVVGSRRALLVDSMFGLGDLRHAVRSLCDLPVEVALTHRHFDHVGGSYQFGHAFMSELEADHFGAERSLGEQGMAALEEEGVVEPGEAWAPRSLEAPAIDFVCEGDVFDLGGLGVEVVALGGHTCGSVGYLVRERRLLLSGDAVTPVMCLFFGESLSVTAWRSTLEKMAHLPFDRFYTGHHQRSFARSDLPSFMAVADSFDDDRPMRWQNAMLPQFVGSLRVHDNGDGDDESFRGIITPGLPPGRQHVRRA